MEDQAVFLLRQSPQASDKFIEVCQSDLEKLAAMPGMGARREFRNPKAAGIRSWVLSGFPNHLVFYRPVDVGIEVLRILHGARDIQSLFDE